MNVFIKKNHNVLLHSALSQKSVSDQKKWFSETCNTNIWSTFIFNLRSVQRRCVYACGHVWLVAIINKSSEKNNDIVVIRHLAAGSNL